MTSVLFLRKYAPQCHCIVFSILLGCFHLFQVILLHFLFVHVNLKCLWRHSSYPSYDELTPPRAPCTLTDKPHQNVHQPMLQVHQPMLQVSTDDHEDFNEETVLTVTGRGTKDYCDWWREQIAGQDGLGLFTVRLIWTPAILSFSHQWLLST